MIAFTIKYLIRNAVKIAYECEFFGIHEYQPFLVEVWFSIPLSLFGGKHHKLLPIMRSSLIEHHCA